MNLPIADTPSSSRRLGRGARRLDDEWQRLVRNDHEVVLTAIESAFEDNEMSAVPVDVEGDGRRC
jgi:hypothetical protein